MTYPSDVISSSIIYLCALEWGVEIIKIEPPAFLGVTPQGQIATFEVVDAVVESGSIVKLDRLSKKDFTIVHIPQKKGDNVLLIKTEDLSLENKGVDFAKLILRRAEIEIESILDVGFKKKQ